MGNSGGRFVWYELATTDIEAAKAFYAGVLGWGTGDASMPGSVYTLFTAGDAPVAGLMKLPADAIRAGATPQWTGYVGVDDVDAAAGQVEKLGGIVRIPPMDLPNVSRFSVIADPEMVTLVLVKGRKGGPEQSKQAVGPGRVVWHELLASDLERAFAFYRNLLGWKKTDVHTGPMGTYQQFSDGTETVGGIFARPEMPLLSQWLYYFKVAGIDEAAKRVQAGGGQILYGPVSVPGGARMVHCTDPQGALFALIDSSVSIAVGCYSSRAPADDAGGGPHGSRSTRL